MKFSSLGLSEPLVRAVADLDYVEPTPVQPRPSPRFCEEATCGPRRETGSGKTAAFVLPILRCSLTRTLAKPLRSGRRSALRPGPDAGPRAHPGAHARARRADRRGDRELRPRICAEPPKTCVAVGGVSINPQMMALRGGADIVVATPGRLLDLVEHNALRSPPSRRSCSTRPIGCSRSASPTSSRACSRCCPRAGRTCCSPPRSRRRCRRSPSSLLHEPVADRRRRGRDAATHAAHRAARHRGRRREAHDAAAPPARRRMRGRTSLVFVASRYAAEHVATKLAARAASPRRRCTASSARARARRRSRTSRPKRVQVLVATDVAARGIDIARAARRRELRPAALARRLPAPHRPHRPRGRDAAWRSASSAPTPRRTSGSSRSAIVSRSSASGSPASSRPRLAAAGTRSARRRQGQAQEQEGQAARSRRARESRERREQTRA